MRAWAGWSFRPRAGTTSRRATHPPSERIPAVVLRSSTEPIPAGVKRRVVVEATENEARGTFTLKLWSQEGSVRGEFFDGVTFP